MAHLSFARRLNDDLQTWLIRFIKGAMEGRLILVSGAVAIHIAENSLHNLLPSGMALATAASNTVGTIYEAREIEEMVRLLMDQSLCSTLSLPRNTAAALGARWQ